MPKKSFSYIEKKYIEHFSQTNTPTGLPLFDKSKIYKVGDQFQDSNGVAYNTVNSNQKFYVLAKQYPTVINGINVIVTAYVDPEWLSPETCWNSMNDPNPNKGNISCNSSLFLQYRVNQGSWANAISQLNPNIETSLYKDDYDLTETKNIPNTNYQDIFNNTGLLLVPHQPMTIYSNMFTNAPTTADISYRSQTLHIGVFIVFKQGFTPPNTIKIDEVFATLLSDSKSSYFSYFFQKMSNNPPDNFTPLISSTNINSFWNKYLNLIKSLRDIPNTGVSCCTIV
jgi:hypothetical protein